MAVETSLIKQYIGPRGNMFHNNQRQPILPQFKCYIISLYCKERKHVQYVEWPIVPPTPKTYDQEKEISILRSINMQKCPLF